MHCPECQDLLSDYIDGHLSDRRRAAVEQHMRECAACTVLKDDLARIIEASAQLPLHTPSPLVWERIQSQIAEESNVVAGPSAWWQRLGARRIDFSLSAQHLVAAAAALVIVVGSVWAVNLTSPGTLPSIGGSWTEFQGEKSPLGSTPLAMGLEAKRQEIAAVRATVEKMASVVGKTRESWSPELQETFDSRIGDLNARIAHLERAFESEGTVTASDRLLAAYREKLHALEEFAQIGRDASAKKSS